MAQKQIPIDSLIDNGTVDIIQSEPQFKKKNSLVYKGILSNMTTETAEGLLSTTGQQIQHSNTGSGFNIKAGDDFDSTISFSDVERVVEKVQTIETADDVIQARHIDLSTESNEYKATIILHKISTTQVDIEVLDKNDNRVILDHVDGTQYTDDAIDMGGYIYYNGAFVITVHTTTQTYIIVFMGYVYSVTIPSITQIDVLTHPYRTDANVSGYLGSGHYEGPYSYYQDFWLGFDSVDMRRRWTLNLGSQTRGSPYQRFPKEISSTKYIRGLGLIDDTTGLVTGEPFIVVNKASSSTIFDTELLQTRSPGYTAATYSAGSLDYSTPVDSSYHLYTGYLDNGVMYRAKYNPTDRNYFSGYTYEKGTDSTLEKPSLRIKNWINSSDNVTYLQEVQNIGSNPTNYKSGTQENFSKMSVMERGILTAPSMSAVGSFRVQFGWCVGAALSDSSFNYFVLDALTRTYGPWCNTSDVDETYARGTRIAFIDFSDPIGLVGESAKSWTSPAQQLFPHVFFYQNDTTKKGVYWDYGKGWARFFYGAIDHTYYDNYGETIFEEPLQLVTLKRPEDADSLTNKDWFTFETMDVQNWTSQDQLTLNVHNYPTSTKQDSANAYNTTSMLTLDDGSPWDENASSEEAFRAVTTSYTRRYFYQNIQNSNGWQARLHPITDAQRTAGTWYYSHSFTGIGSNSTLNAIPFVVRHASRNEDPFYAQVYNDLKISVSMFKTLLTTPHDLDEKFAIQHSGRTLGANWNYPSASEATFVKSNYETFTTWGSGKIQYAEIRKPTSNSNFTLKKITDYIWSTNLISKKNILTESKNGYFKLQRAFIPYVMESYNAYSQSPTLYNFTQLPADSASYLSNDVYYFGFGFNSMIDNKSISTSFLLPAPTLSFFVSASETQVFTRDVINNRRGIWQADLRYAFYDQEDVQEYYTHSQATTDVSYKNSKFLLASTVNNKFDEDYRETTWLPSSELVMYPIGLLSETYGENYITSTVDVGDNYVSRFYNRDNSTFLNFNNIDQVYFGSEIFTIMSGNYYFDGQGIYYLGSQSDYSQNIFTAYAIGMRFLANSSAEAYFYSEWDKSLYIYTASNTLQKSVSLADRGNILDALYSSAEQSLYILFDDNTLYIKSQEDDCLIEGVSGTKLQSTSKGAFVIDGDSYHIYNPYLWSKKLPLTIESEWLGDSIALQKVSFVDVVLYRDDPKAIDVDVDVQILNGADIRSTKKTFNIKKEDWKNQMYRARVVLKGTNKDVGNAVKVIVKGDDISIFNINLEMNTIAEQTSAPLSARY